MGRIFLKLQPPIALPSLPDLVKKIVKELSVVSGNTSPEALETNFFVNAPIVK